MLMLQAFLAIGSGENGLSRVKVQFGRINITAKSRWYGRVSIQPSSRYLCLGGPGPTASNKFTPAPCLRMTTPIRDKSAVADAKHTKHEILAKVTPMLTSGSCSVLVCSLANRALTSRVAQKIATSGGPRSRLLPRPDSKQPTVPFLSRGANKYIVPRALHVYRHLMLNREKLIEWYSLFHSFFFPPM